MGSPIPWISPPLKARLAGLKPGAAKAAPSPVVAPKASQAPAKAPSTALYGGSGVEGLSEYEVLELKEAAGPNRKVFRLKLSFNPDNVMNTVSAIHAFAALRDVGTVLKTVPDFEKLYEDAFYPLVEYYLATELDTAALQRKALIPDVVVSADIEEIIGASQGVKPAPATPISVSMQELNAALAGNASSRAPVQAARPAPSAPRPAPQTSPQPAAPSAPSPVAEQAIAQTIALEPPHEEEASPEGRKGQVQQGSILRVDSRRIDNLLNLVSETVINKATFNQISARFGDLMSELQQSQGRFREGLKDLFDDLPDQLSAIQSGKSAKEIKKEILEKYGSLYQAFEGFEVQPQERRGQVPLDRAEPRPHNG